MGDRQQGKNSSSLLLSQCIILGHSSEDALACDLIGLGSPSSLHTYALSLPPNYTLLVPLPPGMLSPDEGTAHSLLLQAVFLGNLS